MTLLSSRDVWNISGVSNAQLLRWVHSGVVEPVVRPDGNGSKAMFSPVEGQVVRALSRFPKNYPWEHLAAVASTLRSHDDWTELALVCSGALHDGWGCEVCEVDDLATVLELGPSSMHLVLHLAPYQR